MQTFLKTLLFLAIALTVLSSVCNSLPHRRRPKNEAGAVGDSRSVASAELAYSGSNGGYFGQISCLAAPTSCGFPVGTTPFIDAQLGALTTKQAYTRSFVAGPVGEGKPDPGIKTFIYVAKPTYRWEMRGRFFGFPPERMRAFAIDHTGLFCFTTDGSTPPMVDGALSPTCNQLK